MSEILAEDTLTLSLIVEPSSLFDQETGKLIFFLCRQRLSRTEQIYVAGTVKINSEGRISLVGSHGFIIDYSWEVFLLQFFSFRSHFLYSVFTWVQLDPYPH